MNLQQAYYEQKFENTFIKYVEKIIANPDSPEIPRIEKEIDKLIYDLYGLTQEEIAIVEKEMK